MKPPPFEYDAPSSVDEALDLLARDAGAAKPLAGGQSLVPVMNLRLVYPERLVDLNGIAELSYVREADGGLAIGAMTRQRAVERSAEARRGLPLLPAALAHVGHFQIRNRGTIGGSIAHADPAAELPAVLLALDGRVIARRASGEREVPADALFQGPFTTALGEDELLTEVRLPAPPRGAGWGFQEVARRGGDFAVVGTAVVLAVEHDAISRAAIALCGVGPTPVRARRAEEVLAGAAPGGEAFEAAAAAVREELSPPGDMHGSADYRRYVAAVLVRRALAEAAARAGTTE